MPTIHANRGRRLETTVIASQRDVVKVRKLATGARFGRVAGGGRRWLPQKSPVDFMGTVVGSGRAILFDAKSCQLAKRFDVGHAVAPHQRDHLVEQGQAGAVAGLLIEATHASRARFYWLDWSDLKRWESSVPWDDARLVDLGDTDHLIRFDRVPGVRP